MDNPPPTNPPPLTLIGGKSQTDEPDEQMDELASKVCVILSETLERLLVPVNMCTVFTETFERLLAPAAELEFIKNKALLTDTEAAQLFSVAVGTLRNYRSKGFGPRYIKDGSKILYSMVDLMDYYNMRLVRTKDSL